MSSLHKTLSAVKFDEVLSVLPPETLRGIEEKANGMNVPPIAVIIRDLNKLYGGAYEN